MNFEKEGIIKFKCTWHQAPEINHSIWQKLNQWRKRLADMNLIGVDEEGIGYGNISCLCEDGRSFIITGSQTGGISNLTGAHYTKVTAFDLEKNELTCTGPVKASSESMSHGALYQGDPKIGAVIHIHHEPMWKSGYGKWLTTDKKAHYGTSEIALELKRIAKEPQAWKDHVLVMGGHQDGLLVFGATLDDAGNRLLELLK